MQMVGPAFMDWTMNRRVAGPMGNRHPLGVAAPHGVFPCAGEDRWISIAVLEEAEWRGLVEAMGAPDWASAAELCESRRAPRNLDALHERLEWTRRHDDRECRTGCSATASRRRRF
jgi:benzylsuccinate CoA-transferase BbsF subunit